MKKITIILLLSISLYFRGFTAIDPYYKEAIQRGYRLMNDSVLFPDGTMCLYTDFLSDKCGQQWKTNDYCVKEGMPVWDDDRCCEGLQAFLATDTDGQRTCEKLPGKGLKSRLGWVMWIFPVLLVMILLFALRIQYNNRKARSAQKE